jgi:hypothetical protein
MKKITTKVIQNVTHQYRDVHQGHIKPINQIIGVYEVNKGNTELMIDITEGHSKRAKATKTFYRLAD